MSPTTRRPGEKDPPYRSELRVYFIDRPSMPVLLQLFEEARSPQTMLVVSSGTWSCKIECGDVPTGLAIRTQIIAQIVSGAIAKEEKRFA